MDAENQKSIQWKLLTKFFEKHFPINDPRLEGFKNGKLNSYNSTIAVIVNEVYPTFDIPKRLVYLIASDYLENIRIYLNKSQDKLTEEP